MQLLKDRIGRGGPAKGLAVAVVVRDEVIDALHELPDAGERTRRMALSVISEKKRSTWLKCPSRRPPSEHSNESSRRQAWCAASS
jgi:hypothetical protein